MLVSDAAKELGMTRGALWKAIERGRLPTQRIGTTLLIHRADLDQFKADPPKRGWPKGRPRKPPAL